MTFNFDSEFIAFIAIEVCLIGFFLVMQFSSRFNSKFLAGTVLDRRVVERRMMERRILERRDDSRFDDDRRKYDRRSGHRRNKDMRDG